MNLLDIADVAWATTRLDITVRDETGRRLRQYLIGDWPEQLGIGTVQDIIAGRTMICRRNINVHGRPTRGGSEMGWGLDKKSVPKVLATAEITRLTMDCYGRSSAIMVDVDIMIPKLTYEVERRMIDKELGTDGGEES